MTMQIFFDCEFSDMIGIMHDPELISTGFVSTDGREFYAELSDTWTPVICSDFVLDAVIPELTGGDAMMSETVCAGRLKIWIESFCESVELCSDAPQFDWPYIEDLFHRYGWPSNLVRTCQRIDIDEHLSYKIEEQFWGDNLKRGAVRHNAIWDARCLRHLYMHPAALE